MLIEQGPIRPPSESVSLLIRVTRNCPWNRCAFCHTYKGERFSRRPVEDVLRDVDTVRQVMDQVVQISQRLGYRGVVNGSVIQEAGAGHGHLHYHVASWLYHGGKNVFLQDANSLMIKTADLVRIIKYIRKTLPTVERVTTYARASTAARKTQDELRELKEAGLTRIHMGMESGADVVLKMVQKGITAADLVTAGQKIRAAGISLCMYVMPGLGGREHSREHALATADVINQVNPDFMRFRTLSVLPGTPLYQMMQRGEFMPLDEDEVILEQRLLLESLQDVTTTIVSDHILNLLQELEGTMPGDREKMLGIIDRYLDLPPLERANYQLGRRVGVYSSLDDLGHDHKRAYVDNLMQRIGGPQRLQEQLSSIRHQFV